MVYRVIRTVSKQIIALNVAISAQHIVRVDEPSHGRVTIPALEEVEPGFGIIVILAVAQRVDAFLRLQLHIDDISSDYFLPVFRFRIIEVICDVELVVFQH